MAVIRQILETKAATAEECLARISRRARGTMANAFRQVDGKYVLSAEALHETGEIHNIRKLKANANGDLEIELYDAMAADVALLKTYKKVSPAEEEEVGAVIILPDNGRGPVDWEQQRVLWERHGIALPDESGGE